MLKPARRQDSTPKDPDFAIKLARAVVRMGKVNSRIALLSTKLATKRKSARSPAARTSDTSESSEQRLASTLLEAFEMSVEDHQIPVSRRLREWEVALDRVKMRAAARVDARLRFADMYRRFVQRRYPLTWEHVLRQQ